MTEHIASEMRLIFRSDKGEAGVLYRVYARMQGWLTLPDVTYYSSADRSAVLDEYGILIQALCMLARMSAAAANSTALGSFIIKTASPQKTSTTHVRRRRGNDGAAVAV
jgi:predicted metalloendopeptidase